MNVSRTYSIIILNISYIRARYFSLFSNLAESHNIRPDEYELLYDWLVTEALSNIAGPVINHYRHDVYKCVYEEVKRYIELSVQEQILSNGFYFTTNSPIKVLVAGDSAIITKGLTA